ncbi:hypothetical protein J2Y60_001005 [Arcicella sp. BE140]|nr:MULTISPECIES: hypothetical protein [unclassified Arcicella]MDR6560936.1 hypothetical protein [Arcicella sp. BE51]MDR6810820.1 hypothetical protein [Arcicella sp. BE140]MDR6822170.1 hypothetical protein [Arcicella sp. BE139]
MAKRKGLIPTSGSFESENEIIAFSFHGNGCRFEKDSISILDFDYEFDSVTKDFIYIGFEVNRLFSFVINNAALKSDLKYKYIFLKSLLELESSGIILRNKNSGIDNYDYTLANV